MTESLRLHLLNGGYGNGDKAWLERVAKGNRKVGSWIVPKVAAIGDEVVINLQGLGLFATANVASEPVPPKDSTLRYRADLDNVKLIEPPISLSSVKRHIPSLAWARYPRSIKTTAADQAMQVRSLVSKRRTAGIPDLDDEALELSNIEELRKVALLRAKSSMTPKRRATIVRASSSAIKLYALCRAQRHCEGCGNPAPFVRSNGEPYLEVHHTDRRADQGPDHPEKVIALCPNCHRRTEYGADAESFNQSLIRKLTKIEASLRRV